MNKHPFKIGVDARLLSEPTTGIGRYLYEMLSRMVKDGNQWYLYSHKPLIIGEWNQNNIIVKNANLRGRLLRMLWAQTTLPFWANVDELDLFWSPSHRLPRYLPSSIRSVVTIHDLVWRYAGETMRPFSKWLDSRLMIEAVRKADAVIAVSQNTANDLSAEDITFSNKISVIYEGISSQISPNGMEVDKRVISDPYYLFVGTMEPRKNLNRLLEAISLLTDSCKNSAKLIIVGGKGWGGVNVDELVRKYNLSNNVKILGYVHDTQLRYLYKNALFLAMPSLYEGFGLPLIEAMAWGVPSLTSNRSSMPEVIGNSGLLVDPDNVASISQGLSILLGNSEYRNELSSRARLRANQFKWSDKVEETLCLFNDILSNDPFNSL